MKKLLSKLGVEAFRTIWGYKALRIKNRVFFYDPTIRGIMNMPLSYYEELEQDMIDEQNERFAGMEPSTTRLQTSRSKEEGMLTNARKLELLTIADEQPQRFSITPDPVLIMGRYHLDGTPLRDEETRYVCPFTIMVDGVSDALFGLNELGWKEVHYLEGDWRHDKEPME